MVGECALPAEKRGSTDGPRFHSATPTRPVPARAPRSCTCPALTGPRDRRRFCPLPALHRGTEVPVSVRAGHCHRRAADGGSREAAPTSPAGGRDPDTEGPGVWRGLPGPRAPAAPTFCPRAAGQGTAPPTAPSPPRHPLRRPSRQGSGFHTRVWEGRRRSVHGHQNFVSTYPKVRRRVTSVFTAFKSQSHRAASEGDQAFDAITPSPRRLLLQTPLRPAHDAHSPHRSPQPAGPGRLPADAALTPAPPAPPAGGPSSACGGPGPRAPLV